MDALQAEDALVLVQATGESTRLANSRTLNPDPRATVATDGCREEDVAIWAYCLMPNHVHYHVHLIAVPGTEQGLRRAIGEAHRRYARRINFREKWRGYLWQGRFASFVMNRPYLLAAARHLELNPVRANLVGEAADWPGSSARAHLSALGDRLVQAASMLPIQDYWRAFPDSVIPEEQLRDLRNRARSGRPPGGATFVERLEKLAGRVLGPQEPGRKPRFPKQPTQVTKDRSTN